MCYGCGLYGEDLAMKAELAEQDKIAGPSHQSFCQTGAVFLFLFV